MGICLIPSAPCSLLNCCQAAAAASSQAGSFFFLLLSHFSFFFFPLFVPVVYVEKVPSQPRSWSHWTVGVWNATGPFALCCRVPLVWFANPACFPPLSLPSPSPGHAPWFTVMRRWGTNSPSLTVVQKENPKPPHKTRQNTHTKDQPSLFHPLEVLLLTYCLFFLFFFSPYQL